MSVHVGAGWHITHLTDRMVDLEKDDPIYRRFNHGRGGYVRFRAEPGMDRRMMIERAVELAKANDEDMAERVSKQLVPRRLGGYQMRQRELASVFATGEEPELIGVKRP